MHEKPASATLASGYALHTLARTGVFQNAQLSLSLGETIAADRLQETWKQVLAARPALRTSVKRGADGTLVERISETADINWRSLDWRNMPPAELPARWSATLTEEAATTIDPTTPSPIRFLALELPGGHCHLLATFPKFLLDEDTVFRILCDWLPVLEGHKPSEVPVTESDVPSADGATAWWKQTLASAGKPASLDIHPKPSAESGRQEIKHLFDREITRELRKLPCDPALAAWTFALARLTARDEAFLLATCGNSVPLLPCVIPVDADATLGDWLKHVATTERERSTHSSMALDAILPLAGQTVKLPDFSTAYIHKPVSLSERIHDIFPRWINLDARIHEQSALPLLLEAREGDRLALRLEFDPSKYPATEMEKILLRIVRIMETLPAEPTRRLGDIGLLTEEERSTFKGASKGAASRNAKLRIEEDIADVALARPEAEAVQGPGEAGLSYADVVSYAGSLAAHLRTQNLAEGWNIAICLTPTPWLPVAILGVLQAGNTCIPLDASAPASWLNGRLEECDVELIICDSRSAAQFREGSKKFLVIDQQWEEIAVAESTEFSKAPKTAIFLTGSATQSALPLRAITPTLLATTCHQAGKLWDLQPGDRIPLTATPGTGRYIEEILAPLAAGATLVFSDAEDTLASLDDLFPTRIGFSAEQFEAWVNRHRQKQTVPPESLRLVVVEAGVETPEAYLLWQELHENRVDFLQFHSPAGFSGVSLNFRTEARKTESLSLGLPGPGVEIRLLDSAEHPLAPYHCGELLIVLPGQSEPFSTVQGWRDERGFFHALFPKKSPPPAAPVEEKPPTPAPATTPAPVEPSPASAPVTEPEPKKPEGKLSGFFRKLTGRE